tara:strand:+ start:21 stop:308 length:288 start_codon:yes stop_codon:yes gene_type:complete
MGVGMAKYTSKDKKYFLKIIEHGCCVPGCMSSTPMNVHHLRGSFVEHKRSNKLVVPLCFEHHYELTWGNHKPEHKFWEHYEFNAVEYANELCLTY